MLKLSPYVHYQFIANSIITSSSTNTVDSFDYASDDMLAWKRSHIPYNYAEQSLIFTIVLVG